MHFKRKYNFTKLFAWSTIVMIFCISSVILSNAQAKVQFKPRIDYDVGNRPQSLSIGDLDNDGNLDMVVANRIDYYSTDSINNISVLLGNGDGTFQNAVNYGAGFESNSVAIGDLNGDDNSDIVVANVGSNNISVLLGKGDGSFEKTVNYNSGIEPQCVAIGDLNGDGDLDLAVAIRQQTWDLESKRVAVFLGNGDGTFQNAAFYNADTSGVNPSSIAIGDLNGDTKPDIVVPDRGYYNAVVLFGYGNGSFQNDVKIPTNVTSESITIYDINRDGNQDLVAAGGGGVSILIGNGDGSFQNVLRYATDRVPRSLAIGDIDGDGNLDLATANNMDSTFSLLFGYGDGNFTNRFNYGSGDGPWSLAIGDLNNDGALDLAVANSGSNDVSVFIQDKTGYMIQAEDYNEYADSTPGNAGGQYRNDDVDIWRYGLDTYYVGAVASSENLGYAIDPPLEVEGEYRFSIRYATPKSDRSIWFWFESQELHLTLPNTGAWTKWKTYSTNIFGSGNFISLAIEKGGLNIDWFSLEYLGSGSPTIEPAGGTFNDSVEVTLSTTLAKGTIYYTTDGSQPWESCGPDCGIAGRGKVYTEPFTLTEDTTVRAVVENKYAYSKVSGEAIADFKIVKEQGLTIQAEDYDQGGQHVGYFDRTPGNAGGQYRSDDVDIWRSGPDNYYTGANATGEWLNYTIDVPYNGNYRLTIRMGTPYDNRRLHFEFDGVNKTGSLTVPNTGWWTTWQTLSKIITLDAGHQLMSLVVEYGGMNIDQITLEYIDN